MSFIREYPVKAVRKRHRCEACRKHIEIGQPATRWAGMTDGQFGNVIYHPDCREAEVAFNSTKDWRYGDEWYPLYELESDDHEWLRAEFPVVAVRMGILSEGPQA